MTMEQSPYPASDKLLDYNELGSEDDDEGMGEPDEEVAQYEYSYGEQYRLQEHRGMSFDALLRSVHDIAPQHWMNASTADVTVLIPTTSPVNELQRLGRPYGHNLPPSSRRGSFQRQPRFWDDRRASAPTTIGRPVPPGVWLLHTEFILPQSLLLRSLYSPSHMDISTPYDTVSFPTPTPVSAFTYNNTFNPPWTPFRFPLKRTPRTLSGPRYGHPTILIPIPHPNSFPILLHVLYFGNPHILAEYISKGLFTTTQPDDERRDLLLSRDTPRRSPAELRWRGLVVNAEYLGLPMNVRTWLSQYWHAHFGVGRPGGADAFVEEQDDDSEPDLDGLDDDDEDDDEDDDDDDNGINGANEDEGSNHEQDPFGAPKMESWVKARY